MPESLRKTGIEIVGDVPWGTHFCQFYRTPQDLLDILVPYFSEGLRNNEFCMWVTSEPLDAGAARAALAVAVPDLEDYFKKSQIEIIPHTEWYLKGGSFDSERVLDGWVKKLDAALAAGYDGLRLTGNTFWLEEKDWKAFTDYEAAVDDVIGRYRLLAACTYSLDRCGANEILDVIANHRFALVRRGERWELVESADSRRTEEALRTSEERFRALFSSMTEGFAVHEIVADDRGAPLDFRFLDINPSFERLTGLRRADVVGKPVTEVLPGIEPFWIETYGRVALTGEPTTFERYYASPLNRWYQIYAYRPAPRQFAVIFMDITARKQAEEALRRSEERFRVIASSTPDHVLVQDRDLRYTLVVNPQIGLTEREMLGKTDSEILEKEDAEKLTSIKQTVLETGEPAHVQASLVSRSGGLEYFEGAYVPKRDNQGQVDGLIGYFRNVTDRKRAEAEVERSSRQRQLALDAARLGWWHYDPVSRLASWDDRYKEIFGVTGYQRPNDEILAQIIHPEDLPALWARVEAALNPTDPQPYAAEYRINRPDGQLRWIKAHGLATFEGVGASRKATSLVGTVEDITERKKAEALAQALAAQERLRLGAAVEQASDAVVMVDLDGTIRYVNAAFESINRVTRDKAVGQSYFKYLGEDAPAQGSRECIAHGEPWHGQFIRPISGGRPVELEVTISPTHDPSGKVIGGLITEKDVTLENALQRQVRQSQKMEALGTLAGGITHDFNNILSTIFINTELALLDLDLANPARRSLPIVLQAANRGRELVKQIITFSRQREWERKPLEVAPIVKEGLKFLHSTLPKDIVIHESVAGNCGSVLGDPSQIHQVLVNLCQNAALAMADRPGHLEIKLEPVEVDAVMTSRHPDLKPGPYVRLMVADAGCGMTASLMERIFEPFFTTRKHGEGSGLGLAVVHGIVKSYDGAITVYSEPGKGSVFSVYIPRLAGEALARERAERARPERGQEHILVVEDEEAQLKSMARLLEKLGYSVTAKPTGRTALTVFRKNPESFDLVITDQAMPRMTGVELAKALVEVRPDIPIILCTGFSEKVNGETVGHDGIRSFIMKPFTIREVSKQIRAALKK